MGFSIELDEDTARLLKAEAARRNVEPQSLGLEFVRERLPDTEASTPQAGESNSTFLRRMIREVEEISRRTNPPPLPDDAVTREGIYGDHD